MGDHGNPGFGGGEMGIMVWFGDGAGNWAVQMDGDLGYGGVALGDVNGDGVLDVGYGIHHNYSGTDLGDQLLEVALGNGTGHDWQPWDDGLATSGENWGLFGTDFADVDNDGDLDIGSVGFGASAGVHVYLNDGDGTWTQSFGFLGGNSSMLFVFGDVNGDGNPDIAAAHGSGTIYLGDGQGGFALADANLPTPVWRRGIALGDVSGDGRDDLAFATSTGAAVYTWQAGTWANLSGTLATFGAGVALTQIADMDNDGHGDVVLLTEDTVTIHRGDGAGHWTLAATISTEDACDYAALLAGADVDHNGRADLAWVVEEDCSPWVGGTNRLHVFREASVPGAPTVHPVRPRGGEVYLAGSVHFVDWHAAVPQGTATVSIEISTSGSDGPYLPVASTVPNNGRYQWTVPSGGATSTQCYLRLTLHTAPPVVTVTPAPFTIDRPASTHIGDVPATALTLTAAPNPFNPRTTFSFALPAPTTAVLAIHDARGRLVRAMPLGVLDAGPQSVVWDGKTMNSEPAPAGLYLARLVTGADQTAVTAVMLVR